MGLEIREEGLADVPLRVKSVRASFYPIKSALCDYGKYYQSLIVIIGPFYYRLVSETVGFCYQSVNVIKNTILKSDYIKWLRLYNH